MGIKLLCRIDSVQFKDKPGKDSGNVQKRMRYTDCTLVSAEFLAAALERGQTITLAECENLEKAKFKRANGIALDFDNGHGKKFNKADEKTRAAMVKAAISTHMTISPHEVIDRCREVGMEPPLFFYKTFSWGEYFEDCIELEKHGLITDDDLKRIKETGTYRAIWGLNEMVTDITTYDAIYAKLRSIFPQSDENFKHAGLMFGTKYTDTQFVDGAQCVDITTMQCLPTEQESSDPEQITVDTITASTDPPPQQGFRVDLSAADTRSYSAMSQSDSQRRNILTYLKFIPPSTLDFNEWLTVCNAMYHEGFSYSEFNEWSRSDGDPRYNEAENLKHWESRKTAILNGGAIQKIAKNHGMTDEAFKAALYPQGMKPKHTTAPAGAAADQSAAPYDQTLQAIPQPLKEKAHGNGINSADDFEGRCLTPYVFEKFCQLMGYNFKWDVLKHKPVFYGFKKTELKDTLANTAPTILKPALFGLGVKKVTSENISDCILVHATRRAFNPVLEIINGTQWDGVDRLNEIYSMWNITDDFDRVLIHKWLIQCYCMLHNELDGAFGAEYTLVFKGAQGAGKTQFFKHLALHDEFFKEGATLDPNDKDSRLEALSTWICELGELGSTMKKDIDMLKAEMTRAIDIIRPPYARTANEYPRRTSFCATVNDEKFLLDTTGNRRWGIIRLDDDLKVPYSTVKKLNSLQLWAQIAVEVENKITATKPEPDPTTYENAFRLTPEELDRLLKRSGCFVKPVKAQDEVADIIELMKERVYNDYVVDYKPQSATEFKEEVRSLGYEALRKYSSSQIANALEVLGYVNKVYKVNGKSKRGYLLPYHRRK
jgi:hypothetical protein